MASPLFFVLFAVVLQFSLLQNVDAVTCYGFGGQAYSDNLICPGSNACCGSTATCMPNRLCHNQGQNNDTFVRGPCALQPYNPASCAEICLYNETTGFLPRVTVCADGSFCCDDQPNCCEAGEGVFLDSTGDIVSSLPSTSSSTQASTLLASSSTTLSTASAKTSSTLALSNSQTASPSATSSPASSTSASSGLGVGAKAGIGIGVTFGVLIIAGLAILVWVQQRRLSQTRPVNFTNNVPPYIGAQQFASQQMAPKEIDSRGVPTVAELPVHRG